MSSNVSMPSCCCGDPVTATQPRVASEDDQVIRRGPLTLSFKYDYGTVGNGLRKKSLKTFVLHDPTDPFREGLTKAMSDRTVVPHAMTKENLTFPKRVQLTKEVIQKKAAFYSEKYQINLKVIEEKAIQLAEVVKSMEPNSYCAVMVLNSSLKETYPIILYKRKNQESEILLIERYLNEDRKGDTLVSPPRTVHSLLWKFKEFFSACPSTYPSLDANDPTGDLLVLRNAMVSLKTEKYKNAEGFKQIFQLIGVTKDSHDEYTQVPSEWIYTEPLFDSIGKQHLTAVHTLFSSAAKSLEPMRTSLRNRGIPPELIKIVAGYVFDSSIGAFRNHFTQPVIYEHTINYSSYGAGTARGGGSVKATQQDCVYTILKSFEFAGLPPPDHAKRLTATI